MFLIGTHTSVLRIVLHEFIYELANTDFYQLSDRCGTAMARRQIREINLYIVTFILMKFNAISRHLLYRKSAVSFCSTVF